MQEYNCIVVYSEDRRKLLFCKRMKEPYKGLYNFVGGKIEEGEDGFHAAYRELEEETGIDRSAITLCHMMDLTYYKHNWLLEVYVGVLTREISLMAEVNPLVWLSDQEDFYDCMKFAGDGNIGHIIEQVKRYGIGGLTERSSLETASLESMVNDCVNTDLSIDSEGVCIGVDGCKGGWLAAVINHGKLTIKRFSTLKGIVNEYPDFNELLVDMVIGLPSNQKQVRPDSFARHIVRERSSTIFPAPCRQAVYADSVSLAYDENEHVLGKKFTPLTLGIMPKMREIDTFLQENSQFKNVIKESHPEVCFARLNGVTVLSRKNEIDGMQERVRILNRFLTPFNIETIELEKVAIAAKQYKCNVDDIIDAICLAVTAQMVLIGRYQVIP
ncbi:MAG TPA: DUF429 domain-containing protein, partial [Lachnospiraceae bacterium]|nr:DUF429 domain-containing protein [Lachnospiraceae bacterium]